MSSFTFSLELPSTVEESDIAPLAHETDHATVAVDKLLHQFKDKPRIQSVLDRLMEMLQAAEDTYWQLITERFLNAVPTGEGPAEGEQLDVIGRVVGEPRNEQLDAEYITFLKVRILINNSDGLMEQLYSILDLIGFDSIRLLETHPAHLEVYVTGSV